MKLIYLLLLPALGFAQDNEITIKQVTSGDNLNLVVNQIGYDNDTIFTLGGSSNSILIKQEGNNNEISFVDYWGSGETWGGDLDGNSNALHFEQSGTGSKNDIGFHIQGNTNAVRWGQGTVLSNSSDTTFDSASYVADDGGHILNLDIHGSDNTLTGYQKSTTGGDHTATVYLYSDDNIAWLRQQGTGDKNLYLRTDNDGNVVNSNQKGSGSHATSITLGGSYPTTLNLTQLGTTTQGYSLSQNCLTVGGCSVTVVQE
jgi:hypothetical protein